MKYILQYNQPTCWDKRVCVQTIGGYGAYIMGKYGYTRDPHQADAHDDINKAHSLALNHTSRDAIAFHTLVEELPA